VARVVLRVSWAELTQFQEAIRARRWDMMSRERIRKGKKMETKRRRRTLTACKTGHASLFCPELPRRDWLLMSTVWHVGGVTMSTCLRSFNKIITECSGSSTVGAGDRRPGMALLSTGREISQTLKILGRTLERRITQKTDSREKLKRENTLDLHEKEVQTVQGPFLEGGDPQTCHKERQCRELKERR